MVPGARFWAASSWLAFYKPYHLLLPVAGTSSTPRTDPLALLFSLSQLCYHVHAEHNEQPDPDPIVTSFPLNIGGIKDGRCSNGNAALDITMYK